jgi:hypothetical protein
MTQELDFQTGWKEVYNELSGVEISKETWDLGSRWQIVTVQE